MTFIHLRFSDLLQFIRPASPLFAFAVPWLVVLIGQQLALCGIIVPGYSTFYCVVLGNIFTSVIIFSAFMVFDTKKRDYNLEEISLSKKFVRITLIGIALLCVFQMLQLVVCGGFPLLWLLMGNGKTYVDYGISSLNGLLNALYLMVTTALFLICLKERKKLFWLLLSCLLMLPILLVCRQLIMCVFLQISCCLLVYRPKSLKKVAIVFFIVMFTFVVLGNFRTGLSELVTILQPAPIVPEFLHSLLWIYAYIVTPFNNVNAAIDYIQPLGMPFNELTMLLPSVLHSRLGVEIDAAGFELVHRNMNVSTFYLPLIQDFGQIYAFFFMMLVQVLLCVSYRKIFVSRHPIDVIQYGVLYMIVVLSIFSNLLLYLPVVFQLVMIYVIQFSITRKHGVLVFQRSKQI